jgi:transcriptional regulator with XRE-family HTH domain
VKKFKISKKDLELVPKEKEKAFFDKIMKHKEAQEAFNEAEAFINFVEQLQSIMKKEHLTYYAVAKKAGIHHEVLARILKGSKNAEISTLTKVAYGVGAKLDVSLVFEDAGKYGKKVEEHPAFGMWKNRKDMKPVAKYIRKIRAKPGNKD